MKKFTADYESMFIGLGFFAVSLGIVYLIVHLYGQQVRYDMGQPVEYNLYAVLYDDYPKIWRTLHILGGINFLLCLIWVPLNVLFGRILRRSFRGDNRKTFLSKIFLILGLYVFFTFATSVFLDAASGV